MTTWYDELPPGWKLKRLRRVAQLNPSKREVSEVHRDAEVSFIPMEAVGEDGSLQLDRTRPIADVETGYTYFREGDVAFAKITPCFENGKGALMRGLIGGVGFGTTELTVLRPDPAMTTPEFLYRWLSSAAFRGPAEGAMYGAGGQKRVPDEFVREFLAAFPPLPEQAAIAAFLDRETAKIDALVEEQKRLIDLLKEKRQAVISHAVTKGLNPDAPMKDSGIEWLGEVPEHWELVPLKRELFFLTSGSRGWANHYSDDGSLFIRIGNLTRDTTKLDLSDIQRVAVPPGSEGERTMVREGDLLFSITAFLGSVAVAPPGLETAYVSQHVALARLKPGALMPEWVANVTLSGVGKTYLATQGYGGTKIQLSLTDVAMLPVPFPPLEEQISILQFLEGETSKLEQLTQAARAAIDLLTERRAALISAAVTGKIDVRRAVEEDVAA